MPLSLFYWRNWDSEGEWFVSNFTITKWQSQTLMFPHSLFILTCIPLSNRKVQNYSGAWTWYGFPRWLFNRRSGCKQTKLCWEFFSVDVSHIATHIPEMPGLCEYLKLSNTSQLENELLMQVNHLRLQYQYLVSLVDMEGKHDCTRKQSTSRAFNYLLSYRTVNSCEQDWG